ncbi:MAG: hypothetical protein PHE49_10415 [bacterium]|nr:hypothetical protein [bacterium]
MEIKNIKNKIKKIKIFVTFINIAARIFVVVNLGLLTFLALDYFLFLPCPARWILLSVTLFLSFWAAVRYKFDAVSEIEKQSRQGGTMSEQFKGRLFSAIYDYPKTLDYSTELIDEIRKETWKILQSWNPGTLIKKHLPVLPLLISVIALAVEIVSLPSPRLPRIKRFFLPQNKFLSFAVEPGNKKLLYGKPVEIKVFPSGVLPDKISLIVDDSVYILSRKEGYAKSVTVNKSFSYYAKKGDVVSDTYKISAIIQPWIREFNLTYIYSAYTKLPPFVSNLPEISALQGTKINFIAVANDNIDSGRVEFLSQTTKQGAKPPCYRTEVKKDTIRTEFFVTGPDSYRIYLKAKNGLETISPETYAINIWKDNFPEIEITYPGRDMEIPSDMKLPILAHISDDFGFHKIKLVSDKGEWVVNSDNNLPTDTNISYVWDLSQLSLYPGDVIKYRMEVQDNDVVNGYKTTKSEEFKLAFPTVEDIYKQVMEEVNKTQDNAAIELQQILKDLKENNKQIEAITKKDKLDWNDKQALKDALQKEKAITKGIEELSKEIDKRYKALENTMWVDKDLMEKLEELKTLFNELNLAKMDEAIQKMQEMMNKNPELMKEAMKNFKMTQEELRQRIENSLEMLKQYKQEQELASLADRASELAEKQQKLNEKTAKSDMKQSKKELSEEEKVLQKELEGLTKEIDKLSKELKNKKLAKESGKAQKTQSKMSDVANKLSKGQKPSQLQDEVQQELSELSISLSSIHQKRIDQKKAQLTKEINKLKNDFLFLSKEEENLSNASGLDKAFKQEALIKGAKMLMNELAVVMKMTPFISGDTKKLTQDAVNLMENAKKEFEASRQGRNIFSKRSQMQAMSKLNEVVISLMQSEQALQSSMSASGMPEMMQQLSQITKDQQALNQMCMSFMSFNMTQSAMGEQLAQLMGKQSALAEALKEIGDGLKGKALGDMNGMAQEMENIAKKMQSGITKEIVERQNKLLSHLLDTQKSIYTRKTSRQRIAEPGENMFFPSPSEPALITKRGISQKAIIEALKKKYPKDSEQLIKAYFKALSTE